MRVAGGHCVATAILETARECNAWRDFGVSCSETCGGWHQKAKRRRRKPFRTGGRRLRNGDVLQPLEETVEAGTLVPRAKVRQLTAEHIGSAPQFREETVDDELPVKQMMEVRKGSVEQFFEILEPQMVVLLEEVPKIVVGLAVSSGGDGSSGPGKRETRLTSPLQQLKCLLVKHGLPGIAEHSVTTALVPRERVQQRTA